MLAYNEEGNVERFLDECLAYLDRLAGDHEVILVDDGSTDRTGSRARAVAARDPRVRIFAHGQNRGMGAGMRSGFGGARGEYATILAADGQVSPHELDRMLPRLGEADIVLSRYLRRPSQVYRLALSFGLRAAMRLVLHTSFELEGIYLFPVAVVREIGLDAIQSDTFFFSFELITRALQRGYRATTVEIEPRPRAEGRSKVANPRSVARVASELWRFGARLRREQSTAPAAR